MLGAQRVGIGRLAPLLLPLLGALACGGQGAPSQDETGATGQPIQNGEFDTEHTSVVGMFTIQGNYGGMCTGTLIAPNLVLTARHCVSPGLSDNRFVVCGQSPFGQPFAPTSIFFTNDDQMTERGNWYRTSGVRVPPQGNDTCGFDVALVILAGAGVPESVTAPYVPRIDVDPAPGELYRAVGYGVTDPDIGHSGNRMSRGNLSVVCAPGDCGGGVERTEWLGETGVCSGDSGGPALDGNGKVIGVVSRGQEPCDNPVYGSVSRWRDWITLVAREAANAGGYEPPFWVTTGKSDPPTGSGGAGGSGGEGGSAGGAPIDPQGQPCSASQSCPAGFQCFLPGGEKVAYCAAACSTASACGAGTSCESVTAGTSLCLDQGKASGGGDSGGCAVARRPAQPAPWVASLLLVGLVALRSRRSKAARATR